MDAAEDSAIRSPGFSRRHAARFLVGVSLSLSIGAGSSVAGEPPGEASELARLASASLSLDVTWAGDRLVAVGDRGHVLVSDDRGSSWRQVAVPTRSMLTAVAAIGRQRIWAVGHDAVIIHSADGGDSWVRQAYDPEREAPLLDVWFDNENRGIAAGAYGLLMETEDGGATWRDRTIDDEEPHLNAIFAAADGTLYLAAEFGVVFRSRDGGATWQRLSSGYSGSFFGGLAHSRGDVLVFGLRGKVFRSSDSGDSWHSIDTGNTASLLGGIERESGDILLGGLSGVLLLSSDAGRTFTVVNRADRNGIAAIVELAAEDLLLTGEAGVCVLRGELDRECEPRHRPEALP